MWRRRQFLGGMAAGLAALALVGCGTSTGSAPSSLDPARLAPANSLLFAEVTVRPQGGERAGLESALHKLFGAGVDAKLQRAVDKIVSRNGDTYAGNVAPWLGQRVGVVVTRLVSNGTTSSISPAGIALIAPTNNPGAARTFIEQALKRTPSLAGGLIGHYAVLGGALAYQAVAATSPGRGLSATSNYQAAQSELGAGAIATAYANTRAFLVALRALNPVFASALGGSQLAQIPVGAATAAGLTVTSRTISYEQARIGFPVKPAGGRAPAEVGVLPASSWLALATGGGLFSPSRVRQLSQGLGIGLTSALSQPGVTGTGAASLLASRLGFIERDVLPALGPLLLSVSGTSPLSISAGIALTPSNLAAADRLLGLLRGLIARNPALNVVGSGSRFSVGLPTGGRLTVGGQGRQVVATYGFPDARAFLRPASTLWGDATYQQALGQLPNGSSVPLYVSFGPIAALVQLVDRSPSAPKTVRVLHQLRYLIAGGRGGDDRIVLGLN